MKIEFSSIPSVEEIDFLTQQINDDFSAHGFSYPFGFFSRNEHGEIIAGCNGSVIYGAIYTDQIWVHKKYRMAGLGRQLMDQVHKFGRQEKCTMATVATMDFQGAVLFYEKLGYRVDFKRHGYESQSTCLFLKKDL